MVRVQRGDATVSQTFKHAVIACHPDERSFTLSVARRYSEAVEAHGHEVVLRDLYRMGFDPVLGSAERTGTPAPDVAQEWAALGKVDVYVLVYPIWFGTPPAMLKGYIDRVFGAGRNRGREAQGGSGVLLAGRRLVSLTSSGSFKAWLSEKGVLGSLRTIYDRYFAEVFGFEESHHYHFDGIVEDLPERDVSMHLHVVEKAAREVMSRMVVTPPDRHPPGR
jgi:NAD(P)H dehydrogenase (quinone)